MKLRDSEAKVGCKATIKQVVEDKEFVV